MNPTARHRDIHLLILTHGQQMQLKNRHMALAHSWFVLTIYDHQKYASPEQLNEDNKLKYTSKTDIFSLGIVFFELLCPFKTGMERIHVIQHLRDGFLPDEFVKQFPKESMLVLWMTSAEPKSRPTIEEIMQFEFKEVTVKRAIKSDGVCADIDCSCCGKWQAKVKELEQTITNLKLELSNDKVN